MTLEPDPVGPVPQRRDVDVALVRRLVVAQFPEWAALPVRPVPVGGWDNHTFRLGEDMLVRLPSAAAYALAVEKEQRWLPVLAPHLPLPIPVPLALGEPGAGYPHPWSVYRWLGGAPASAAAIVDLDRFAITLADFLAALQQVDPRGGPTPGQHNWFRGGPLRTYHRQLTQAVEKLADREMRGEVTAIWRAALRQVWDGPPVWFHGDVAAGNLLLADGALTAVIDFGTCGVGDPACDLAIAWTLLSGSSRAAFRGRLSVDTGTWARGRGWALWKAVITYTGAAVPETQAAAAKHLIDQIITDHSREA
ncbi:aminoglycoside phosphotransferase family protein [Micromonospora sp. MS34]|uniref:aminoglycoside phosphotransferase family protein n=1 Tax=Micromonospora sp. MS34 TaxID=3385971 RepID=UPI0039A1B8F3